MTAQLRHTANSPTFTEERLSHSVCRTKPRKRNPPRTALHCGTGIAAFEADCSEVGSMRSDTFDRLASVNFGGPSHVLHKVVLSASHGKNDFVAVL
jgi:hypothetical protein